MIVKKLESDKNLREEANRFWAHISAGHYDFLRSELHIPVCIFQSSSIGRLDAVDVDAIRSLTLVDVVEAFDRFVCPRDQDTRKKLSVQLVSHQMREEATISDHAILVEDETMYRLGLGCYPAAVPQAH